MNPFRVYLSVLIVSGCVLAAVLLPAVEAALGGSGGAGRAAMAAFSRLCHQDPDRSLVIFGAQLAVCARCMGCYLGAFAVWAAWYFVPRRLRDKPVSNLILILGLGPMAVDGMANLAGLWNSPDVIRLTSGLLFGAVAARSMWPALLEGRETLRKLVGLRGSMKSGEDFHVAD